MGRRKERGNRLRKFFSWYQEGVIRLKNRKIGVKGIQSRKIIFCRKVWGRKREEKGRGRGKG